MSGLVRVRENGVEHNTGVARAEALSLVVLDEPTHRPDGRPRRPTRAKGRPIKPRKSVEQAAAEKSAEKSAGHQPSTQAAVIESAPTNEEQNR